MPEIYYSCCDCRDHGEGTCYPHDMVRKLPNGEWICQSCYDEAPPWTHQPKPADWTEDSDTTDDWHDLPPVPKHVPEAA